MPATPSLKVCHFCWSAHGERWIYDQLEALGNGHGFHVSVVLGGESGRTADLFRAAAIPVKVFDLGTRGPAALVTIPWRILRLALWMRRERFDVVQSHLIQSTLFARPAAWLADVPVRVEMVPAPIYMQMPLTRRLERATARMDTAIVPTCEFTAALYRDAGIGPPRLRRMLYYGPAASEFDPARTPSAGLRVEFGLAEDAILIGSVAMFYGPWTNNPLIPPALRFAHVKGQDDLIRAFPAVLARHPGARLVLVGTGYDAAGEAAMAELRALTRCLSLADHVIFAGFRDDVAAVYRDLDVSVQASRNDNLGGTVESLLMARPTVATRVGGMVDSVVDGETGILVAPGDPADLARGILAMLDDPESAARMAAAGRERMLAGFTLSTTAEGLAALYREGRAAAPGARRLGAMLGRMMLAAVVYGPILVKALVWDHYLTNRLARALRRKPRASRSTPAVRRPPG